MTHERAPKPNPVDLAKTDFDQALSAENFDANAINIRLALLQSACVSTSAKPAEAYRQLVQAAGRAVERATLAGDQSSRSLFSKMEQSYQTTLEALTPNKKAAPRRTSTRSQNMSLAKK